MTSDNDHTAGSEQERPSAPAGSPVVVGVGASVGSAQKLERLLADLARQEEVAVVVVLQHREALSESWLEGLAGGNLGPRITPARDGARIEAGQIYLCAPDTITTIQDGVLSVRQAEQPPGERGTIDSFLVSLAQSHAQRAIGVLLAGTNGDGTLGVAALKDQGGLAIAEAPANSLEHLADARTPAAIADLLLPLGEIGSQVAAYMRNLQRLEERQGFDAMLASAGASLTRIAEILRNKTGNDFHGYKQNTFLRRVQRRMQVVQINDVAEYVEFLRTDKDEVTKLFNDLLIGVTQFFRDKREFEVLETEVIPKLFDGKRAGSQVRVWVLGCATGEEAYSIGILLREHMATLESPPQVQIFATDLDGRALAAARVGRYRTNIEAELSPERLARWFVREGDTYCIVRELREMCIFSQHNVLKDAPFSRLDLISCRNLLIYLNAELQNRVIPLFHFALLPERYLFLGNSENVTRHPKLFVPVDRRARIFKRLDAGSRVPPQFPITTVARSAVEPPSSRPRTPDAGLERRAQRVAERYAPAYVITDEHFQVLHFSGRTGRYLEPSAGAATLDLLNLVHRDLRLELRAALNRALERNDAGHAERVQMGLNGDRMLVDINVEVLQERPGGPRSLVVVFKDGPVRPENAGDLQDPTLVRSEHVERLEAELRTTHDRLQSTIEELESTNEELKSSNEEYQSLNEELQSANEELETSREELQSVNEELTTVNGELHHRVQELTRATSDLKNFLESTQIATIFLDNDLKVMNFTPTVTQVFHLVETDIGRPIAHIKAKIPIEDLFGDARRVVRTLASVEREVTAPDTGTRYIARILPYRSVENYIAGVVMTFVDVTAITRAEERTRMLLAELQHRVRNTLGVVRSIVRRTAETSSTVEDFAMHLDGRLNAFARTQALVTRDPEAGVDLEYLVADELMAYRAQEAEQVRISGPALRLQPKAAETLGLAIHELATNAVKYGALSAPKGTVEVSWSIRSGATPELALEWRELGGVPIERPPERRGFGTELLERTLAFELTARTVLAYEPSGLRCSITIPLTGRTVMPAWRAAP
ncbi:CheR family methyltransferase [Enterovirga aerilata]|uniref:Methyltransferase n=1 Tax=Enterovirga aerilata TaxID=2730920 RepID=A0A849IML4_9HYPH|nr:CheR family methyltransferase [Enterovirga sp. DB1703]NNM75183.1 methyltransferase [Enterovirga sp. DB1703]